MSNPFAVGYDSSRQATGIVYDWIEITPNNSTDNIDGHVGIGVYLETAGDITILNEAGVSRTFPVAALTTFPCSVSRVMATGTDGSGTGSERIYVAVVQ